MILALILTVVATIPHDAVLRDSVDVIERNSFYDDCGRRVFVQWIFWSYCHGRLHVTAWRLDKDDASFQDNPPRLVWTEDNRIREVRAASWRETWTQWDPELSEREILPVDRRKGLSKP